MIIKEAIYRYLQTIGALTALVGTKIFRDTVPESTIFPYIYFFLITGEPKFTARTATDIFQFSIFAVSPDECDNIYLQLLAALQNHGTLIGGSGGKIIISSAVITNRDAKEFDTGIYHKPVDIKITYWR